MDTPDYRSEPVSFARRGGRLTDRQQRAWDALSDSHILDIPRRDTSTSVDPNYRFDPAATFGRTAPLIVEIGSGRGEAVVEAAAAYPDTDFLALEVYIPGIAQTLVWMQNRRVDNVRIALLNAAEALETTLEPGSVDELWVFFPDPWPKLRHHKRRLVTPDFAAKAARVLKPGGVWRLATDWQNYADGMRKVLQDSPDFEFDGTWAPRFEGRLFTRFENKGLAVDREIRDLKAIRI
ncbi:MAG: tRNA (guanosine(46)-N7)-methyltransferase TrmB [Aeromicrobium sp.]